MVSSYIRVLEKMLCPVLSTEEVANKKQAKEYELISLSAESFIKQLNIVAKLRSARNESNGHTIKVGETCSYWRPKFCDVGCGIGTKLILTDLMWYGGFYIDCIGIENTITYVKAGQKIIEQYKKLNWKYRSPHTEMGIIHTDAIKYNYGEFDIIYFYCPIIDDDKQEQLERHIINTAKSGAYIMANLSILQRKQDIPNSIECLWKCDDLVIGRKR